jgi:hypothetical protein
MNKEQNELMSILLNYTATFTLCYFLAAPIILFINLILDDGPIKKFMKKSVTIVFYLFLLLLFGWPFFWFISLFVHSISSVDVFLNYLWFFCGFVLGLLIAYFIYGILCLILAPFGIALFSFTQIIKKIKE